MTHVVSENCIKCKYTDCVDVCLVDCFVEGPNMLVINPDECIDCAVCVPECPANAIFAEEDLPAAELAFIKLNAELTNDPAGSPLPSARPRWPTPTSGTANPAKSKTCSAKLPAQRRSPFAVAALFLCPAHYPSPSQPRPSPPMPW